MSGIAAVLNFADPAELQPVLRMLERRGPDGTDCVVCGSAILGCARLDTLPEDGPQPIRHGPVIVVADARLDNRDALEQALGMPKTASEAELIAAAVAKWGERTGERLEGDFAVIAWDGSCLMAIRDRFGVRPLFYAEAAGRLVVASEIHAITAHPALDVTLDLDYFVEYLAARMPLTRRTPYLAVHRLMPGEVLTATPGGIAHLQAYYSLAIEPQPATFEEAAEQTRNLLEEAVRVRLRAKGPIACDVSGGMDSTSVYATARALGVIPHARSIVSDAWPILDERAYSRELLGDNPWIWVLAEEHPPFTAPLQVALAFDEPVQDVLLGTLRRALNEARPDGCTVALSGHGGDATMTAGLGAIRHLVRRGRFLAGYLQARQWADERDQPLLSVLEWAMRARRVRSGRVPWASRRVERQASWASQRVQTMLTRMCGTSAEAAALMLTTEPGIRQQASGAFETRYPFLHRPLVEHALSLPPTLKAQGAMDKLVLRRAMADRLPQVILERIGKTAFDERYASGIRRNWSEVAGWLREPVLADLGLLDAAGVRTLVSEFRDGLGRNITEVVFILALEAWLRCRFAAEIRAPRACAFEPHRRPPAGVEKMTTADVRGKGGE